MRFGIYATIGCIPWTAALASAGYAVGGNWQSIVNGFRAPTYIIGAAVLIGIAVLSWRYGRRRRAENASRASQRPDATGVKPGVKTTRSS